MRARAMMIIIFRFGLELYTTLGSCLMRSFSFFIELLLSHDDGHVLRFVNLIS